MHQPDPLSLRPGDLAIGGRSPHLLPADGEKFLSPRGERGEVACVELISKGSRRVPLARATNPPGKCSPDCSQAPGLFLARVPANVSRILRWKQVRQIIGRVFLAKSQLEHHKVRLSLTGAYD